MEGGGVLEILLVSAEGFKHAWHLCSSSQYVVIQCGSQIFTSKSTSGKDKGVWWNEKFIFKLSYREWKELDRIALRIMERGKLVDDRSIGETTIYIRGILREGSCRGSIELNPAPYNIVLEDGSYEGEIKVGLRFSTNGIVDYNYRAEEEVEKNTNASNTDEKGPLSVYRTIFGFVLRRIQWPKVFFLPKCTKLVQSKKEK